MALVEVGGSGVGIAGAGQRSSGIEIRIPNLPLWVPDAAKQLINDLTMNTLRLALQLAAGAISQEVPVDSGALAQSFGADPATSTGGLEIIGVDVTTEVQGRVFSSLPYAVVMDQGRRAGSPISRVGIDAIGLWAQRKLGLSAEEASVAKWAIATYIVQHGIVGHYYFEAAMGSVRPTIENMFTALTREVATQLTTIRNDQRTAAGMTNLKGRVRV